MWSPRCVAGQGWWPTGHQRRHYFPRSKAIFGHIAFCVISRLRLFWSGTNLFGGSCPPLKGQTTPKDLVRVIVAKGPNEGSRVLCKVARSRRGMVKRLAGSICYERLPRGMGGDFSPVPSGMAEGLTLGSARFLG